MQKTGLQIYEKCHITTESMSVVWTLTQIHNSPNIS